MSQHNVTIEVANRRLKIACPKGKESALLQSANEINRRLEKDKKSTKTPEQAMLMVALNLANDLLDSQNAAKQQLQEMQNKIDLLQETIEQAVNPKKKA
ncbi:MULTISPECIES: cell division protein ZapA [Thalassotalea]|uniref:Cell division protein ZapA n=1 Tax=Thalassotalea castellviae TaxID=3075612 RepID=A0ABU2ZWQ5_9GAMM|nr:cell division protein ZapA [Thalassotalea sp. W431]MDT0602363.1 cell division protein ZapA [Thalassotalea sp. W431]